MDPKIRISKHEYRNRSESQMTKIPNGGVVSKRFRSLENLDFEIVSDFEFRISNLFTGLPKQNEAS